MSVDPNAVPGDAPADASVSDPAPTNPVDPAGTIADAPVNPAEQVQPPFAPPPPDAPVSETIAAPDPNLAAGDGSDTPPADPGVFPAVGAGEPLGQPVAPVDPGTVGQDVRPDVVSGSDPVLAEQATDPATGEPLTAPTGAAIIPLDEPATAPVDPIDNQPPVATVQANPDPSGAAAAVLDRPLTAPVAEVIPSRSELAAQQVIDEGTLTPAQPGSAVHPVETLDHHTVDPSGTADDHMPGLFAPPDAGDTSLSTPTSSLIGGIDQRVDPADRNKGIVNISPQTAEDLFTPTARVLAESGVHRDLLHQWVDQVYADLQGQNASATSAGDEPPFPNVVF